MADTPDPHPERPVPTIATRLRKFGFALAVLLVFYVVFGQGMSRLIFGNNHPPAPAVQATLPQAEADDVAGLKARVEQLEAKIKALEDVVAASPHPADGSGAAPDRLAALEAKVDALSQHSGDLNYDESRTAQLEKNIKNQDESVQAVKQQISDLQTKNAQQLAAMAAFAPLKDDIARGGPYTTSLNTLAQLSQGNAKAQALIDQLRPFADKGAVTVDALQDQFEASVDHALAPSSGGLLKNLKSLVRVRRVGKEQQGTDDESVVARAEAKLEKGDIAAASQELGALSPAGQAAFAEWNGAAHQWLQVKAALDELPAALAASDTPPAPAPAATPEPVSQAAPPANLAPAAGDMAPAPAVTPPLAPEPPAAAKQ